MVTQRDGAAAAETLADDAFDLALLDTQLPSRDGFEVLEEIPEERRNAEAWYAIGRVHRLKGDAEASRENLLRAYEADPNRYEVLKALAEVELPVESVERDAVVLAEGGAAGPRILDGAHP